MTLIFEYPAWFLFFCAIAGVAYAGVLYFRNQKLNELPRWILRLLAAFRFTLVSCLSFLLLSPLIKTINREVEKPIVIVAQDNSESLVVNKDSTFYKTEYIQQLQKLVDNINNKYDVKLYSFGDKLHELVNTDSLKFNEKQTDISQFFNELETRYANRNVGAIIVATDGLYNSGVNPLYASDKIKTPVYTIALGDTTVKKDIILLKAEHNRTAYLGNKFPIEIIVSAKQLKGKSTTLTVFKENEPLFSQNLNFNSEAFISTIPVFIDAKEIGLQHYKIKLSSLPEEVNVANNNRDVFIEVLDEKQKIAIIAAAPHPDVAAIKDAIESNQNYEVESFTLDNFDKPIKKYNLLILHQLPSSKNPIPKILSDVASANIPVWSFTGNTTILKSDLTVGPNADKSNECEALLESNFALFTLSDELRKISKHFPVISCPHGTFVSGNTTTALFYQRIGIVDTKTPLMAFNTTTENKIAVFNGEGIWRWQLYDYSVNGNHNLFNELISKTAQYLSVKADKSFFKIQFKHHFQENENIEFTAEVYNESYELINEPEVTITIFNTDNKKFPFTFGKINSAYHLNAGIMPVGEYKFEAKVKVGDKIYTQRGAFSINALNVEQTNTIADHQLLFSLAQNHNGSMLYPSELLKLNDILLNRTDIKSVSYSQNRLTDLINLKWIFFVLLILLSLEWFLRKRNGAY